MLKRKSHSLSGVKRNFRRQFEQFVRRNVFGKYLAIKFVFSFFFLLQTKTVFKLKIFEAELCWLLSLLEYSLKSQNVLLNEFYTESDGFTSQLTNWDMNGTAFNKNFNLLRIYLESSVFLLRSFQKYKCLFSVKLGYNELISTTRIVQ